MIDKDFLQKLIKKPENITKLNFESITEILNYVKAIFENENLLLEFDLNESEKAIVIGDIHGNLETLIKLVENINEEKPKPKYTIFLGDIVDRGPKQFECLILVYILKILYPQSVYILKGNHETFEMNKSYGFFNDFINKFKDYSKFNLILSVYRVLPYCAIINKLILCLHGGIPEDFEIINKIRGLKANNYTRELEKSIGGSLFQIIWNDPKEGLKNFSNSFRGPDIKFFGEVAF
ncbi:MAG TPA: metallophosphoesterase, partial [Candidatus Lokiarchaeia archaeon]